MARARKFNAAMRLRLGGNAMRFGPMNVTKLHTARREQSLWVTPILVFLAVYLAMMLYLILASLMR
jgi:hypothetical protein